MDRSPGSVTRKKYGVRNVSSVAISTHSMSETFAELLRPFTAKDIAGRLDVPSVRTVENWKEKRSIPQGKHVVAMLTDDDLCMRLLEMAGRGDIARSVDTIAKLRAALGAVEGK